MGMIAQNKHLPFPTQRAIAAHFSCSERTVSSWTLKPDWPSEPTPANVAAFLDRNDMKTAKAAKAKTLEAWEAKRIDPVYSSAESMVAAAKVARAAADKLTDDVTDHAHAILDEVIALKVFVIIEQMKQPLTGAQIDMALGSLEGRTEVLREVNPYDNNPEGDDDGS